jgi:hypothetical protein
MKTIQRIKHFSPFFLIALAFLFSDRSLLAQATPVTELKNFVIVIEKSANRIKMQNKAGCAWDKLAFSVRNDVPQAVDQFGRYNENNGHPVSDPALADFLFTITKTKKSIELKGIRGTAWKELTFTLSENQKLTINQNGMAD